MKQIVKVKFGSHLYGTNTPESDLDFKSVHIPGVSDILLQTAAPEVKHRSREKGEGEKNTSDDVDDSSYSLKRFLELCGEGQTVAIDMLFAPQESLLLSSGWWRFIVKNRYRLISKKSAAFLGYCRQQANKYGIKGSRVASAKIASEFFWEAAKSLPPKSKVGDCNWLAVHDILDEHNKLVEHQVGSSSQMGWFFECCGRKVSFTAPVKDAATIFGRIYENYGDRARLAQDNEGVDWKALSHAVRVGTEAVELLNTGNVTFPLPNRLHILDIKQGRLPYEKVSEEIEQLLVSVEEATAVSKLPDEPDRQFMQDVIYNAHRQAVLGSKARHWDARIWTP